MTASESTSTQPLFRPFPGLRPIPERAQEVAAPPYDVLDSAEARIKAERKPYSFLHISKPEIDLPVEIDPYAPEVYAKAAENLTRMVDDGVLRQDPKPCFYIYRLEMDGHVQTGIVGGASVAAYDINRIRKHEYTRPDKEDDRVRQILATNAQTGPVLLAHHPIDDVTAVVAEVTAQTPAYSVLGDGGVRHTLWVVDDDARIGRLTKAFDAQPALYIADGHHRSAAASRVAKERQRSTGQTGEEPYNAFLAVTFPADEMRILDYNRVVRDLGGLSAGAFMAKVEERFLIVHSEGPAKPDEPHTFGMYLEGRWYSLRLKDAVPPKSEPVARLDVSLLADRLIEPILGIDDPRRDKRIDFVGGIRGLEALERRVDSGEWAVAFAMYPTRMADLMAVADADAVMPPKSTWFEPKLADGMVSLVLD